MQVSCSTLILKSFCSVAGPTVGPGKNPRIGGVRNVAKIRFRNYSVYCTQLAHKLVKLVEPEQVVTNHSKQSRKETSQRKLYLWSSNRSQDKHEQEVILYSYRASGSICLEQLLPAWSWILQQRASKSPGSVVSFQRRLSVRYKGYVPGVLASISCSFNSSKVFPRMLPKQISYLK